MSILSSASAFVFILDSVLFDFGFFVLQIMIMIMIMIFTTE